MQKKLLTSGNVFKRTDGRWCGVVWYRDSQGERKRKSFSGTTKQEVSRKIKDYIADFESSIIASDESKKRLRESMQNWLELFKFPAVERSTYDRLECTAKHQIYPVLGDKVVGDITSADIRDLLNQEMVDGYAYTTVKKVHVLLNEYFRYLTQQELIVKNPMVSTPMIKKSNFLAAQDKENLPEYDTVTDKEKQFSRGAGQGKPARIRHGNRVYPGRNRAIQDRSLPLLQQWQAGISTGSSLHPHAEHGITHR